MRVEAVLTESAPVSVTPGAADVPAAAVAFVSDHFFASTGARMAAGRPLDAADETRDGPMPVVVSHVFWTTRLNQEAAAIGRAIRVGRADAVVVGVAARGFSAPGARMLWMPMTAYGAVFSAGGRRTPDAGIQVFGRLLPGATLAEAEAQLSGVAAALPTGARMNADSPPRTRLDPHAGLGRLPASDTLAISGFVFAVIGLVLVLACANVATVLVSTAMTRDREMGVRAALGASRSRIVRQLVTESLLRRDRGRSWTAARALGSAGDRGDDRGARRHGPRSRSDRLRVPRRRDAADERRRGPRARLARARHQSADATQGRQLAPGSRRTSTAAIAAGRHPVGGVGAADRPRELVRAGNVPAATIDVGFDPSGLYTASAGLGDAFDAGRGAAIREFWRRALPDVQAVAGVSAVSLAEVTPFDGVTRTAITGDSPARVVYFNRTQPGYFEALGVHLVAGRVYSADEVAARSPVALVSESVARAYWPGGSALGQLLPAAIPVTTLADLGLTGTRPVIIGVVSDAITARLEERSAFAVYEPLDAPSERFAKLVIRVAPGAAGAISQVNQRLRAVDPQAAVTIASVADRLRGETGRPRMVATLSGVVGVIAIVLCVVGLYGLTASVVAQRAREMAVRVALGAETGELLRLLMWDSLRPVVAGLVVGGALALFASRAIGSTLLFGVSPQDPTAFASATAALLAAATLAVIVPTRRGAAIDAWHILRQS